MATTQRLLVGLSGASGIVYGVRMLQALKACGVETHLIMSRTAEMTLAYETDLKPAEVKAMADVAYAVGDLGAGPSSGSFRADGMVIAPCSVRSLAEIANGTTASLLTRAADVTLKERRRLVLMVRETPLHAGHLRNMLAAAELGAIIAPPMPALYARPATIEEMVDHTVGRVLDLFGLETDLVRRWTGQPPKRSAS